MVTGFFRLSTSSSAVLLLLSTMTTTTLIQNADGASSTTAQEDYDSTDNTDNTESCPTEEFACLDDLTCASCVTAPTTTNSAKIDECIETASSSASGTASASATTVCTSGMATACCMDEISEHECRYNELFVEFMLCVLENEGCLVDEISCDTAVGSSNSESSGGSAMVARIGGGFTAVVGFYSALVVLSLPILWV